MRRTLNVLTVLFQTGLTLVFSFCVYMLFALFDYKGGIANFVGIVLFQPLAALLAAGSTLVFSFIVGLPIRINRQLNIWWRKHFYVSLFLALLGLGFCAASLTPLLIEAIPYGMDGMDLEYTVPNKFLSITGWFILSFGLLHLFPPYWLQQKVDNLFTK
ncbi:hypothetical protein [Pontibacter akesuensis]|uniref:Uncharacterized protein n=1 Tax=Pontibacter akesuensis TaxID=388950 RepID=A0A1I7K985_9BACT|nr:hypothetical protein [Pontibacter akesuensis]SFU93942.1 hypothetical protein SAMN04487941_3540 [Pontibacter akesuensis]